ncbi:phosphorylase family protein [Parasaccharibacter apium]|uniref:Nucleoside phosphorylase domain-containing protein n=1 Tax=Parasaccharibacter apium TaxID=1510841 RepID=A0ABX4ZMB4_9PROT|nr:hypothetical protein [Parasaccharibacter apium]POS63155.1 hypothetical protein ASQ42_05450 [Parasaccharibacter apium]POS63514.1 hypothetical protein ASO19_04205 [Parasaccharibacter apium]POS64640.1 hypothetical protein ASQ43_05085 [Parasaccharibacter apium]
MLGVLAGLRQEARLARRFFPGAKIALSHACETGARQALQVLQDEGVTALLSFGCSGALDAVLPPGSVQVAEYVQADSEHYRADPALSARFGAAQAAVRGGILHSPVMIGTAREKADLFSRTGCHAVDMESGLVARSGLPFAVLRVICDDAGRDLPPAAREGLKDGRVHVPALLGSILRHPVQIGALIGLGRDAARAHQAMADFLETLPLARV